MISKEINRYLIKQLKEIKTILKKNTTNKNYLVSQIILQECQNMVKLNKNYLLLRGVLIKIQELLNQSVAYGKIRPYLNVAIYYIERHLREKSAHRKYRSIDDEWELLDDWECK